MCSLSVQFYVFIIRLPWLCIQHGDHSNNIPPHLSCAYIIWSVCVTKLVSFKLYSQKRCASRILTRVYTCTCLATLSCTFPVLIPDQYHCVYYRVLTTICSHSVIVSSSIIERNVSTYMYMYDTHCLYSRTLSPLLMQSWTSRPERRETSSRPLTGLRRPLLLTTATTPSSATALQPTHELASSQRLWRMLNAAMSSREIGPR